VLGGVGLVGAGLARPVLSLRNESTRGEIGWLETGWWEKQDRRKPLAERRLAEGISRQESTRAT
jgi:hypothetical protein